MKDLEESFSNVKIGGRGDDGHGHHDHDDDASSSFSSSYSETGSLSSSRDEVKQIRDMSKKDTFRVKTWRLAVTVLLLGTAVAVTATTYHLLNQEEYKNFEIAVSFASVTPHAWPGKLHMLAHPMIVCLFCLHLPHTQYDQFSRTVADSAIEQQRNLRNSLESLATAVS